MSTYTELYTVVYTPTTLKRKEFDQKEIDYKRKNFDEGTITLKMLSDGI